MPRFSVWAVRLALIYLAIGFTFGGLMLWNKGLSFSPFVWRFLTTHIEFLLLGWTLNLVIGMAYWILPRFGRGSPRGSPVLSWTALVCLNLGVMLAGFGPLIIASTQLQTPGHFLQALGTLAFVGHVWPRVRPSRN